MIRAITLRLDLYYSLKVRKLLRLLGWERRRWGARRLAR